MFYNDFDTPIASQRLIAGEPALQTVARPLGVRTPLEMHLNLTNGTTVRFVQPDADSAERLLQGLQPQRLFRKPQIVLASDESFTTFPSAAVEHIALLNHTMPAEWPAASGIDDVMEFSPDALIANAGRISRCAETDWFLEFEMRSCRIVYLRVRTDSGDRRLPLDTGFAYAHLLDRPVILGRRSEGGIFLLNPANVVRITAHASRRDARTLFAGPSGTVAPVGALPAGHCYS